MKNNTYGTCFSAATYEVVKVWNLGQVNRAEIQEKDMQAVVVLLYHWAGDVWEGRAGAAAPQSLSLPPALGPWPVGQSHRQCNYLGKKKIPQFKAIKRNLIMSLTQQCWEETNCFSERVSLGFSAFPSVLQRELKNPRRTPRKNKKRDWAEQERLEISEFICLKVLEILFIALNW